VHTKFIQTILLIVLGLGLLVQPAPVQAQAGSTADLINLVNAYRAASGREAYQIDGGLMTLAQSHSEYQASIQTCTHQRADGSGPEASGISAENIACGGDLSVEYAVYTQWADAVHTGTMLGPETGLVGAGVAILDGVVYYTLAVKRLTGEFTSLPAAAGSSAVTSGASQTDPGAQTGGLLTSTPNSDGSISHIVAYGETLIDIAKAYGLTLADLIAINKLDPNSPVIYARQALLIRLAFTETPFMTATYTPRPPTRTPLPTRTPRPTLTLTPLRTPLPTRTTTTEPPFKLPSLDELGPARPALAYTFIAISALGLILLVLTSFLPRKKD
jgi:uncharacterized protein YkwD